VVDKLQEFSTIRRHVSLQGVEQLALPCRPCLWLPLLCDVLLSAHVTLLPLAMTALDTAFIEHAVWGRTSHTPDHVLAPLLSRLFRAVRCSGHVPPAWKGARLTPLFTKGDRSDPNDYRLNAVSPVVYWVFAGVVNTLLVVSKAKCACKGAFYFFPGHSCQQAQFIFCHLAQRQ
jgi:hypothetical protein